MDRSFCTWVEVPVRVYFEHQPAERETRHYPGCPEAVVIETIEFALPTKSADIKFKTMSDLVEYVWKTYEDNFEMEAWEHKDD